MDFLHVQDIANAFKFIIDGDFLGIINISSGSTNTLEYISKYITKKFNSEELLELNNSSDDRRKFFGNNTTLKNLGWSNKYSIKDGLDDLIKFYVKKYE
jgi:nucleoside-diphosphate-sugar epimerase